jgi:hemerythrin
MKWKDEYSVGIIEIDNQHKLLLQSFSAIVESINLDKGWSNTHYAIVKLNQLAHMHFSFEEAMMRMFGYPEAEAHQKEHHNFFAKLESIEKQLLTKSADVEMVKFLRGWLTTHILGSDRGYAKHIFSGAQVVGPSCDPS